MKTTIPQNCLVDKRPITRFRLCYMLRTTKHAYNDQANKLVLVFALVLVFLMCYLMELTSRGPLSVKYSWQSRYQVLCQVEFILVSSPAELIPQQVCEVLARTDRWMGSIHLPQQL